MKIKQASKRKRGRQLRSTGIVSLRRKRKNWHSCPTCRQDMREEPHDGLNGKDCPQCGQGMSWRRAKRKQLTTKLTPLPLAGRVERRKDFEI